MSAWGTCWLMSIAFLRISTTCVYDVFIIPRFSLIWICCPQLHARTPSLEVQSCFWRRCEASYYVVFRRYLLLVYSSMVLYWKEGRIYNKHCIFEMRCHILLGSHQGWCKLIVVLVLLLCMCVRLVLSTHFRKMWCWWTLVSGCTWYSNYYIHQ